MNANGKNITLVPKLLFGNARRSQTEVWERGVALIFCLLTSACQQDMARQPRYRPLQYSEFFSDHRSARPLVAGTVAREHLRDDAHFYTGKEGNDYATTFPFEITESVLERGRQRYTIFCSLCHDNYGTGAGKIVERGFTRPTSYHTELHRGYKNGGTELPPSDAPVAYYFHVI